MQRRALYRDGAQAAARMEVSIGPQGMCQIRMTGR